MYSVRIYPQGVRICFEMIDFTAPRLLGEYHVTRIAHLGSGSGQAGDGGSAVGPYGYTDTDIILA